MLIDNEFSLCKKELVPWCVCTLDSIELVYCNEYFEKLFGLEASKCMGNKLFNLINTEINLKNIKNYESNSIGDKFIFSYKKSYILGEAKLFFSQSMIDAKKHQYLSFTFFEITNDCFNMLSDFVKSTHKDIFDSLPDGILIIDSEGKTLNVNKTFMDMSGLSPDEILGVHVSVPVDAGKYFACVTLRALEEKRPVTMFDDYGNGKRFLNTSTPIFDDAGKVKNVVACIRDMAILENLQKELSEIEARISKNRVKSLKGNPNSEFFVGSCEAMEKLKQDTYKAARVDSVTLILGETGTGKSLTAYSIHKLSNRASAPFVTINCGAIPASLMESELFGYEKGAFTGAHKDGKIGLFESAKNGTVFLDEIGELPLDIQVKLLHVLDGGTFTRVGGVVSQKLEARVLAATNKPLKEMVDAKKFRDDLYYRLNVLHLTIPPLRERKNDIEAFAKYFFAIANERSGLNKTIAPEVFAFFKEYSWPGNVRELKSTIEYLIAMTEKQMITAADLPNNIRDVGLGKRKPTKIKKISQAVAALEKDLLEAALKEGGSTWKAAKILGINQSTVVRKAKKYKIGVPEIVHNEQF